MAFNGSGTFNRTNGTHSGGTVWADDEAASLDIESSLHDTHDQDLANGLSNCICKDGQTTITANIPFNNKKITGLAAATARTDAMQLAQFVDGAAIYGGASTGSSNAYAISLTPAITSYVAGQRVVFIANHTSTGAATLNVNGLGAVAIRKGAGATALDPTDIRSGQIVECIYEATTPAFHLFSQPYHLTIAQIGQLPPTNDNCIVGNGTAFVLESGATFRTSMGCAASGSNSDITALTGIARSTWTPTVTGSGSMTVSSLSVNQADYARIGPWIYIRLGLTFTLGGTASNIINVSVPVAGVADNTNLAVPCAADENGVAINTPRWRYDGSNILVFKGGLGNFTLGANAAINIDGKYRAV